MSGRLRGEAGEGATPGGVLPGTMAGVIAGYRAVIPELEVTTCRAFARKARDFMRAYQDGVGIDTLDKSVSTTYKSHRKVFDSSGRLVASKERALTALEKKWQAREEVRARNRVAAEARRKAAEYGAKSTARKRSRADRSDPSGEKRRREDEKVVSAVLVVKRPKRSPLTAPSAS